MGEQELENPVQGGRHFILPVRPSASRTLDHYECQAQVMDTRQKSIGVRVPTKHQKLINVLCVSFRPVAVNLWYTFSAVCFFEKHPLSRII